MQIIVHGSIAYDRIMNFPGYFKDNILPDKIHALSVSFYIENVNEMRGGTGGNIVYNFALLEESPSIITSVGKDGGEYLSLLQSMGVNTDNVSVYPDALTSAASIITDRANNQITAFSASAAARPASFDFSTLDPKDTFLLFAPANNKPDALRFIEEAKKYKLNYLFDPGQTIPDFSGEELLSGIDGAFIFTSNDYELELVKKKTGLSDEAILDRVQVLVTTLGARGSVIRQKNAESIQVPAAIQDTLMDPTGAGDAYRAGFTKGFVLGLPLKECGQIAVCTSSYVIEHIGTQEHAFTMDDFRTRYTKFFGAACPI
jgi:adenosine kinase